jgi:hypothetical protein
VSIPIYPSLDESARRRVVAAARLLFARQAVG